MYIQISLKNIPCRRVLWTGYDIVDDNHRVLEVKWEAFCWTSRVHFTAEGEKSLIIKCFKHSQTFSNTLPCTFSHTLHTTLAYFVLKLGYLSTWIPPLLSSYPLSLILWNMNLILFSLQLVLVDRHFRSKWMTASIKNSWPNHFSDNFALRWTCLQFLRSKQCKWKFSFCWLLRRFLLHWTKSFGHQMWICWLLRQHAAAVCKSRQNL